jgi:hypothetical protein
MSRIPNFPFRVLVTKRPMAGSTQLPPVENHNYENMAGAIAYRDVALRRPNTKLVQIVMVLDETSPSNHFDRDGLPINLAARVRS